MCIVWISVWYHFWLDIGSAWVEWVGQGGEESLQEWKIAWLCLGLVMEANAATIFCLTKAKVLQPPLALEWDYIGARNADNIVQLVYAIGLGGSELNQVCSVFWRQFVLLSMFMQNVLCNVLHMYSEPPLIGPLKCVLIRGVSSFQGANNTYLYEVGTWSSVLIREVSSFQRCPLRGVPLYCILIVVLSKWTCNSQLSQTKPIPTVSRAHVPLTMYVTCPYGIHS